MKEFKPAIWSSKVRRWTVGMLIVLSLLTAAGVYTMAVPGGARIVGILCVAVVVLTFSLIVTLAWATAPASYIVSGNGITVHFHRWKDIEIAWDSIADVAQAGFQDVFDQASVSHNMAYMFSAAGTYWSPKLNDFNCFCTNQNDLVVIKRKTGNPVVISPADSHGFIEAVRNSVENEGQHE